MNFGTAWIFHAITTVGIDRAGDENGSGSDSSGMSMTGTCNMHNFVNINIEL